MDFNVKKLVKEAGTAFNRVVQLTEEKLGTSEKTELDAHFEHLAERADATRIWTEKIVANVESVLTPNLGSRLEDFVLDKIEKKKPNRLSNLEYLGIDMIEAGNDFGPGTPYGSSLIKVGQCESRLGAAEREFISNAHHCLVSPLRKFLDGEMKTIQKERSLLESKRLDLDACKNRLRKARTMQNTQAVHDLGSLLGSRLQVQELSISFSPASIPGSELAVQCLVTSACLEKYQGLKVNDQGPPSWDSSRIHEHTQRIAERDLRVAQNEFDRQAEITKLLLEGVTSSHASHLRCLQEFVEAQVHYQAQCNQITQELHKELSLASASPGLENPLSAAFQPVPQPPSDPTERLAKFKARVLYDYDAKDSSELSLLVDEIITVREVPGMDPDYLMGERGTQKAKVPRAFLELLSN